MVARIMKARIKDKITQSKRKLAPTSERLVDAMNALPDEIKEDNEPWAVNRPVEMVGDFAIAFETGGCRVTLPNGNQTSLLGSRDEARRYIRTRFGV